MTKRKTTLEVMEKPVKPKKIKFKPKHINLSKPETPVPDKCEAVFAGPKEVEPEIKSKAKVNFEESQLVKYLGKKFKETSEQIVLLKRQIGLVEVELKKARLQLDDRDVAYRAAYGAGFRRCVFVAEEKIAESLKMTPAQLMSKESIEAGNVPAWWMATLVKLVADEEFAAPPPPPHRGRRKIEPDEDGMVPLDKILDEEDKDEA